MVVLFHRGLTGIDADLAGVFLGAGTAFLKFDNPVSILDFTCFTLIFFLGMTGVLTAGVDVTWFEGGR